MAGSVRYTSLNAATLTGPGLSNENFSPRYVHSMQVILAGGAAVVQVDMEATFDGGTTWGKIGEWNTTKGNASGDIVSVEGVSANRVRANLIAIDAGNVTAIINSEPN